MLLSRDWPGVMLGHGIGTGQLRQLTRLQLDLRTPSLPLPCPLTVSCWVFFCSSTLGEVGMVNKGAYPVELLSLLFCAWNKVEGIDGRKETWGGVCRW